MQIDKKDRPTKFYSTRQERQVANALGGTNDIQSGGGRFNKYDVTVDDWVIECKTKVTPHESMTICKDWFKQVEQSRIDSAKSYAALCFSFGDGKNYYAVDEKTFKLLLAISRGEV